jgi:hypothetical protein
MEGLTEGRIVHFITDDGIHRPAVVTHVWNKQTGNVNLFIFPDGSYPLDNNTPTSISFDAESFRTYTWHWVEKA